MHSSSLKPFQRHCRRAFTLVEMLVVIAIMSILMTAGAIGLGGLGGKGVTSGTTAAEAIFDEARSLAVGQRVKTRVLIARNLTNNPSENLRRIAVAYQSNTIDPVTGDVTDSKWYLSSRGLVLPDQVYFSQEFSKKDHAGDSGALDRMSSSAITDIKSAWAGEYFYYEFNAEGICQTPGASVVIGTGSRATQTGSTTPKPRVVASSKRDFSGFVVWRNGSTSLFRSPSQISSAIDNITPGTEF